MKKNSKLVILGLVMMTVIGLGIRGLMKIEESSISEPVETIPVFDIGAHPDHPFYAIGEQVILTVTVQPADASDKTVVWTSSEPAKVSITKLTESTARMECLAAFTGEIVITATATNGTADPADDFSITCTVTYVVPLTAIELVWAGDTGIDPATDAFEIGDVLYFNVEFTPSNATDKVYTYEFDADYMQEDTGDPWSDIQLEITAETLIGIPTEIEIVSHFSAEVTDSIGIQVGVEFNPAVNPSALLTDSNIYRSTNSGTSWTEIGNSLNDYTDVYEEYGYSFNTGDFIKIDFGTLDFKANGFIVHYDSSYLEYDSAEPDGFIGYDDIHYVSYDMSDVEFYTQGAGVKTFGVRFEVINPISASSNFTISIELVNYEYTEYIPFAFTRPVSGISIDTGTYVF